MTSLVYTLLCEDGYHYVGITQNMNLRWAQHCQGFGSNFTRIHKPEKLLAVKKGNLEDERTTARVLAHKLGPSKVSGGGHNQGRHGCLGRDAEEWQDITVSPFIYIGKHEDGSIVSGKTYDLNRAMANRSLVSILNVWTRVTKEGWEEATTMVLSK